METGITDKFLILYAEDDPDDLQLVIECFQEYSHLARIQHAQNGQIAIEYLKQFYAKDVQPCLIILDINMPVMDGRQALMHIKSLEAYKDIPVVLFTTSSSILDKAFAEKWGAGFVNKPLQYDEIKKLAHHFVRRCREEVRRRA